MHALLAQRGGVGGQAAVVVVHDRDFGKGDVQQVDCERLERRHEHPQPQVEPVQETQASFRYNSTKDACFPKRHTHTQRAFERLLRAIPESASPL